MEIGLYGKLPSHGDFLRRRVSDAFADPWDVWLQTCLSASRNALGDRWLDVYLTSPAWRFVCASGACGNQPVAGLMAPSVDRVGRYFPLTIVAALPIETSLLSVPSGARTFFERAERLVIDTLAAEDVDFERFDEQVSDLATELSSLWQTVPCVIDRAAAAMLAAADAPAWQIPLGGSSHLSAVFEQLLSAHLSLQYEPLTLWWTEGSAMVEPSCLIVRGLPSPEQFVSLLDGLWTSAWQSVPAEITAPVTEPAVFTPPVDLSFRSVATSDPGRVRQINQDSFIERPLAGVWAVADGMGGHRDGEVASRMVCDALADLEPSGDFEETVAAACARVMSVNEQLLRHSARSPVRDLTGSTVVMLLARGIQCAIVWAGDSRVYRWRGGQLERLTRDHSVAESETPLPGKGNALTRAVGVQAALTLAITRSDVQMGDRFLLCSDGLTHTLTDAQIQGWIGKEDIKTAVDGLVNDTLVAGAPDNVTVLIAEAC